ncbi:MAG: PEP-utilizing enzyme, partial [Micrococcales bacterium]
TEGVIANSRDVYWLTEQEIDEIVNGHAWDLSAKQLVANRKKLLAKYSKSKVSLAVHGAGRIAPLHLSNVAGANKDGLAGNGVAPGVLKAPVVVATEFDANLDVRGKILVVHHIDPGWTLLFTQAAGIVSERGNALSHAAIIAREIGIPCVVGAVGITSSLKNGDVISINGITGSINREKN